MVSWFSCRSNCPISDKVAPDRRSSVARLCRKICAPRWAQPSIPTRSRAALAIMVIAHPEAKLTCGASVRTNSRQHVDFGRPLRRYATIAAPMSSGIGIRARCRPLARTSISLARQSISSSVERRNLVGPQAEIGQQQQNGVVAPSHHRLSVATVESLPHLSGRQIGR